MRLAMRAKATWDVLSRTAKGEWNADLKRAKAVVIVVHGPADSVPINITKAEAKRLVRSAPIMGPPDGSHRVDAHGTMWLVLDTRFLGGFST